MYIHTIYPCLLAFFPDCDCVFSEWTDWVVTNRLKVPPTKCPSESALTRERKQLVISGECDCITETAIVECKNSLATSIRESVDSLYVKTAQTHLCRYT